jgi:hypothetical protein
MEQFGIIIHKAKNHASRMTILDAVHGMQVIYNFYEKNSCAAGLLIKYKGVKKGQVFFVESCIIENSPFSIARNDIYFLHHVLELVYFFVPIGSCTRGLFDHLLLLYRLDEKYDHVLTCWKKLFLCKLIFIVGLYPEKFSSLLNTINQQIIMPIDRTSVEFLHLAHEAEIDQVIVESTKDHPAFLKLKTICFLENYRKP